MDIYDALRVLVKQQGVVRWLNFSADSALLRVITFNSGFRLQYRTGLDTWRAWITFGRFVGTFSFSRFAPVRANPLVPVSSEPWTMSWIQSTLRGHHRYRRIDVFDAFRLMFVRGVTLSDERGHLFSGTPNQIIVDAGALGRSQDTSMPSNFHRPLVVARPGIDQFLWDYRDTVFISRWRGA